MFDEKTGEVLPDAPPSMSESIKDIATALAKAQGEMDNATLNKVNPHYNSKYADLAAIRDATIPHLAKNGIAIMQYTRMNGDLTLCTRMMHSSGQWIESTYPLQIDKPQAMGSQITYARRYCWSAMCGIAADEDDDAEAAQGQKTTTRKTTEVKRGTTKASGAKAEVSAPAKAGLIPVPQPENGENMAAIWKVWSTTLADKIAAATSADEIDVWIQENDACLGSLKKFSATGATWESELRERASARHKFFSEPPVAMAG